MKGIMIHYDGLKTKGPQIRCINVNLAAKEHAG